MGYNNEDDLELQRLRREAARRKAELEELQREELRRIQELEARKNGRGASKYDPNLDSAFYSEEAPKKDIQMPTGSRQTTRPERQRPVSHKRTFDPDQAVSDEEFINSFEEEVVSRSKRRTYDDDEYEESFEEAEEREIARERREKQARKNAKKSKKAKKKKSAARKFITRLIAVLLIIIILFSIAIGNITRRFNHIDSEASDRAGSMKHKVVNVLLIGQDARDGQSGQRSDSMILLSINTVKNSVSMTSIMRDTYVDIPGYGGNRINAAYAFGGIDLLDKTIEQNFDITIDGNAMVDFDGFLEAMTAVGNLEMTLTADEAAYMNANPGFGSNNDASDEVWNLTEGKNTLTPSQLLAYSRIRYVGNSDWDRTQRQRNVMSAALSKVKHGHLLSGYNMASKAAPSITTDVNTWGMLRMASGIITGGEMKSHIIPVEGTYYGDSISGMSVLVPDLNANREYLKKYIDGEE